MGGALAHLQAGEGAGRGRRGAPLGGAQGHAVVARAHGRLHRVHAPLGVLLRTGVDHDERAARVRGRVHLLVPLHHARARELQGVDGDGSHRGQELLRQLQAKVLHLLKDRGEGPRTEGDADVAHAQKLHELVQHQEDPQARPQERGRDVDGELHDYVGRGGQGQALEHEVLGVRGRGERVDVESGHGEQLRLEDAQVGVDGEDHVHQHDHVGDQDGDHPIDCVAKQLEDN
mmetsp:Transcript_20194/g.59568  ORF Transcript_20194/g.59568 Transcript_20194/m.59568 type:complete len:231 (+) Transcript_20194:483-1175(+)